MTIKAATLRKLAALNLAPDQMAGVLELLAEQAEADESRREAQAERKRRQRARGDDGTVTRQSRDETETDAGHGEDKAGETLSLPPSPQTPQPPTHTREKNNTRAKRSHRCPEIWAPSRRALGKLTEEGFSAGDLERALTRMRDHEFRDAHTEWDAVFRNWVRNNRDRRPQPRLAHERADHPDAKLTASQANNARAFAGAAAAAGQRWRP